MRKGSAGTGRIALGGWVAVLLALTLSACADGLGKREPILFGDGRGGAFEVSAILLVGPEGTHAVSLPRFPSAAVSEERVDLSGTPLVGEVFKQRLGPADIEDNGLPIGPVIRIGQTLVVETGEIDLSGSRRQVVLSSEIDRLGAISHRLGKLGVTPASEPLSQGMRIGEAYLLGGALALVADGARPSVRDLEDLLPGSL